MEIRSLYEYRDSDNGHPRRTRQIMSNSGGEGAGDPGGDHPTYSGKDIIPDTSLPSDLSIGMLQHGGRVRTRTWPGRPQPCCADPLSNKGMDRRALWSHNARDLGTLFLGERTRRSGSSKGPGNKPAGQPPLRPGQAPPARQGPRARWRLQAPRKQAAAAGHPHVLSPVPPAGHTLLSLPGAGRLQSLA